MPSNSSSSVLLDVNAGDPADRPQPWPVEAASDDPFRILILGDFSGGESRPPLASRIPQEIDRDNFDEVLARLGVQVALRFGPDAAVRLKFRGLADFEPDSIFERCELFHGAAPAQAGSEARRQSTRHEEIEERGSLESDAARITSGSLLDDIVAGTDVTGRAKPKDDLQAIVDRLVAPHLDRYSPEDRSNRDRAHSAVMRAVLHDPQFQALESAWRALDMVARGLDTDGALSIHILDVTKAELDRGLKDLAPRLAPREPWAVIVCNFVFDRSAGDVALLKRLGDLAVRAGAPVIAESAPPDEDSESPEWRTLRGSPEARWLGLALPRFLARVPYGKATYEIEKFAFEEVEGAPEHRDFLWANPAFACALLLGRAFEEYGWKFRPGAVRQMSGLPFCAFEVNGEMRSQPCAEILLTDHQIEYIQEQGCMALAPMKNSDVAMLVRFQSIADPVTALAGRWKIS